MQVFQFAKTDGLSVRDVLQDDFQRAGEVVVTDEVVFLIILIIDDKKTVAVFIILVINLFNQSNGLSAVIAGIVVEEDKDYRFGIIVISGIEIFLHTLVGIVGALIYQSRLSRRHGRDNGHAGEKQR